MFDAIISDKVELVRDDERMDFKAFAQIYRYLRFFMKYSQTVQTEVKAKLNIDEFKALL